MPTTTPVCWRIPDILLFGWIPLKRSKLTRVSRLRLAKALIYRCGNDAPPQAFTSLSAVRSLYAPMNGGGSREYRAMSMLEGTTVTFAANGAEPEVETGDAMVVGYTPMLPLNPLLSRSVAESHLGSDLIYLRGTMVEALPRKIWDPGTPDVVTIVYRSEFKLGQTADAIGRMLTGYWAPHAWFEARVTVSLNGDVVIEVETTGVPSVRLYVSDGLGGALVGRGDYDMSASPLRVFGAFIETDENGCRPAPRHGKIWWQDRAAFC